MRKIIFLCLIFFVITRTYSQNYNISFAGTGAATTVDSVKVENLNQGTTLTMSGSDILHLGAVGINDINTNKETIKVYPNPMQGQAEISFYAKETGNTQVFIYDINGKVVVKSVAFLTKDIHKYQVSGLKQGMYFINIIGDNYAYTTKLVSQYTLQNEAKLTYLSNENPLTSHNTLKSTNAIIDMAYTIGDNLRYTGYAGIFTSIVNDIPNSSKTITFTFAATLPTLTTTTVSAITSTTAISGGNLTSDGGASVTARGICYSTSNNPTTADSVENSGSGIGSFISNLSGLTANTTYYLRAFATNSLGTAYGNQDIFSTLSTLPSVSTAPATAITSTTATTGGNVISDGGVNVTARGICYSTTPNPTISNTVVNSGSGIGSYTSNLIGLTANTTYYIRAFATNSIGISYGNQISIITLFATVYPVYDIDGNGYDTVHIGLQIWLKQNLKVTHYRNGDSVSYYCYNDSVVYKNIYGLLYNWYAVADSRNLCPTGWHVPSNAEWATLTTYLGGESIAGGKLKEAGITHWNSPNTGATNVSYFTGLPAGLHSTNGYFSSIGSINYLWTSSESASTHSNYIYLTNNNIGASKSSLDKNNGLSIRCLNDANSQATLPIVTTSNATNFTSVQATFTGNVVSDGGAVVTKRGFCFSIITNPTIASDTILVNDGLSIGNFYAMITTLTPNTIYYVRAFATNSAGTAYGNEITFTTKGQLAIISTSSASAISEYIATIGGQIINDGGNLITARGICYKTSPNPYITNNNIPCGTGFGSFSANLTNLIPNTIYYARAYAINNVGTAYGNQVSFITTSIGSLSILTTTAASLITATSAISGGNITSDGGTTVTTRGICYSTTINPTIINTKIISGNGIGSFNALLSALIDSTTYYIRAYAINNAGTAYGNQISFTTLQNSATINDIDGNVYDTVHIGSQIWLKQNLKVTKYRNGNPIPNVTDDTQWATLSSGSYCWYDNDSATYKNLYGALYNYYAVVDSRNLCPIEWHVPSDNEWTILTTYLGGDSIAGNKLKEVGTTHWIVYNIGATNESGFVGLPGGFRSSWSAFYTYGYNGYWWSSTDYNNSYAWFRELTYNDSIVLHNNIVKTNGFSVRCVKDTISLATLPTVTTSPVLSINPTSAISGGNVTSDGGSIVTARGICYSLNQNPTISDSVITSGYGIGSFTSYLTNLIVNNTTYYIRAYATNSIGTAYGNQITYTTITLQLPTLITTPVLSIASSSATSGGNITSDGGSNVTTRGICYDTIANSTISNISVAYGSGIGYFSANLSGLTANTNYYIKAYATNSIGTAYGNEINFITLQSGGSATVTDIDANVYDTVHIGTQIWLKQNLKVTHYRNGDSIPNITDQTQWDNLLTPAYCWYNNDELTYKNVYGALYNWYTINTGNLCPNGWHVPTNAEFATLIGYLGGSGIAGGKLKEMGTVHWSSPNTGATNQSGFTALGGGFRPIGGFWSIGSWGYWWTSTEYDSTNARVCELSSSNSNVDIFGYTKKAGGSVRCIKD